jgi:hypothetical protein
MKLFNQHSDPDLQRQITTLAAVLGSIAINTLSNVFPLNGVSVGNLSNTLFASVQIIPANYAFAIWGLIYIGLIAFGIYQLQPSQRQNPRLQHSGYLLAIACISQCAWIYLFLDRLFPLSNLAMLGILVPLMVMYQRLEIGQERVSRQERWLIHIPISIYLGWISVASVVNVAIGLYSLKWDGWGITPSVWTMVMMTLAALIAAVMSIQRHDTAYVLVIIWALVAISIRQASIPSIVVTGWVLAIVLMGINLTNLTRNTSQIRWRDW